MRVVGHKNQIFKLLELLQGQIFPSAILFAGPAGVGKKLIASKIAKHIMCEKTDIICETCKSCILFEANNSPDLFSIDGANVLVEEVRETINKLLLKSFLNTAKILIIDNADQLNAQSYNALLKTVEEPRENTYIFLITSNYSKLPQTLISRCQLWNFNALSNDEVESVLKDSKFNEISAEDKKILVEFSCGSLENVNYLREYLDQVVEVRSIFHSVCNGDISKALGYIEKLKKDKEKVKIHLGILKLLARNELSEQKSTLLKRKIAIFIENISVAEALIFERNLNTGYVLQSIFFKLANAQNQPKSLADDFEQLIDGIVV